MNTNTNTIENLINYLQTIQTDDTDNRYEDYRLHVLEQLGGLVPAPLHPWVHVSPNGEYGATKGSLSISLPLATSWVWATYNLEPTPILKNIGYRGVAGAQPASIIEAVAAVTRPVMRQVRIRKLSARNLVRLVEFLAEVEEHARREFEDYCAQLQVRLADEVPDVLWDFAQVERYDDDPDVDRGEIVFYIPGLPNINAVYNEWTIEKVWYRCKDHWCHVDTVLEAIQKVMPK